MGHSPAMMSIDAGLIVPQLPLFILVKKYSEITQIKNVFKIVPALNHMLMNPQEDATAHALIQDMLPMQHKCVVLLSALIQKMEVLMKPMAISEHV